MKKCSWCGKEYPDDAVVCTIDQTPFAACGEVPVPAPAPKGHEYDIAPLSEADKGKDLVTLVTCGTVMAADMIATRLRAAGIETFIPDECLMQAVGWNLNAYGYVRVQVAPKDYESARDLLTGIDHSA